MLERKSDRAIFGRADFYAFIILAAIFAYQCALWPKLPLFIDCYYHLSVARGFADAGGWVGEAFWEFAPVGRPHVYPPLLHILQLCLFRMGLPLMVIAKLFDLLTFPFFWLIMWGCVRRLFSARVALFFLVLGLSSFPGAVSLMNNIPFTMALLWGMIAYLFLENRRQASAILALALACYSHAVMACVFFLAFVIYGLVDSQKRARALSLVTGSAVLAAPLFYHQWTYRAFVHRFLTPEFYELHLHLPLIVLSVVALVWILWTQKRRGFLSLSQNAGGQNNQNVDRESSMFRSAMRFFLSLTLAMGLLWFTNRNRLFAGHGWIPLCVLTAVALARGWEQIGARRLASVCYWVGLLWVLWIASPTVICSVTPARERLVEPQMSQTWFIRSLDLSESVGAKAETIYYPQFVEKTVDMVRSHTDVSDILYSNFVYAGGMVASLANRATSTAMMKEVDPFHPFDQFLSARYILWFKDQDDGAPEIIAKIIKNLRLTLVDETDIAMLLRHDSVRSKRHPISARIPFSILVVLLVAAAGVFFWDLKVMLQKRKNSFLPVD